MENDPVQPPDDDLLAQLRDMPVGVNDPNIIGDAGPTDIPPGTDPPLTVAGEEAVPLVEEEPLGDGSA